MVVRVEKPEFNLRSKLNELDYKVLPYEKAPRGSIIQTVVNQKMSTTQKERAGAWAEFDTDMRIDFSPYLPTSQLLLEFFGTYNCKNSTHLQYAKFYDNTAGATVSEPTANGSRDRCHWVMRTSHFDNNDANVMHMMVLTPAVSTDLRQYTIYMRTEGVTIEFYSSDLSTAAGATTPCMFKIQEIRQ